MSNDTPAIQDGAGEQECDDELTLEVCPNCGEDGVAWGAYCQNTGKPWPTTPPSAPDQAKSETRRVCAICRAWWDEHNDWQKGYCQGRLKDRGDAYAAGRLAGLEEAARVADMLSETNVAKTQDLVGWYELAAIRIRTLKEAKHG